MTEQELLDLIDRAEREGWTELDLRWKEIATLPPEIGRLVNLTSLELGGNQLTTLPPEVGLLIHLTSLYLWGNQFIAVPTELTKLVNLTELSLSVNPLTTIPPEIGQLVNLTELYLSYNQLTTIPHEIGQLTNLTHLDFRGNPLTYVPREIGALTTLQSLSFDFNHISIMPPEVGQLNCITNLKFSSQKIVAVPPEISQLVNLTSLDLSYNELVTLPPEIGQLVHLTHLNLRGNLLTYIPLEIGFLTNLQSFFFDFNHINIMPPEVGRLACITELKFSSQRITNIPPQIGYLVHLTHLDFSNNQLTAIPPEIGKLVNLILLTLSRNQLTTIPSEISQLVNLTSLDLDHNKLTSIPSEITQLINLRHLDLSRNQLKTLIPEIGRLVNLVTLDLWGNQLAMVPPEISQLGNLTLLGLSTNQLTTIPPEIGQLSNLTWLSLGANQLATLLPEITQLTNLTSVRLYGNLLTSVPSEITQLVNLTEIHLAENDITTLPYALTKLAKLESIYLYGNPLPIPPELLGTQRWFASDPRQIFEAYFQQCTPLHQLKLMLLGEGTVGKTSLAERLLHNQPPSGKGKTVGVEIWPWEVEIEAGDRDRGAEEQRSGGAEGNVSPIRNPQSTIRINLWDFGGQEIYHATHQFFLTHRSLYVLVVDARQDDEANRLAYWLQLIASFGGDSPVLLVVNKIDQGVRKLAERELYAQHPNLRGILYTSCTTGEGIGELRHALAQTIATMPHVNDQIPTRWMAVKNKLAGLGKDFISYDKFEELCEAEEISHPATRATLAKLLHDLGSALHFAEENNLAGTHILQPDWVTHGIYNLLNAPDLQTKGVLPLGMVGHILDRTRYPFHKHEFLLEIMEKFELCFRLPEHRTWLIPTLLPPDRPDFAWPAQSQPAFQLHYTILLPSIIGRLMVRLHQHTWQGVRWRDGFVLAREGARAQVRAIRTQNRIAIWLDGDPAQRRSLLTLIRAQLDEIHASFAKLGVEAFVPIPNHAPHVIKYEALVRLAERGDTTYYDPNADANIDVFGLLDALETPIERLELLLHKRLMAGFDLQELKTLVSMDLGLDYDEYPQDKKSAFARELLLDCKRNGRLERLQNALLRQRP